jgi:Fatty acid desaturase
MAELFNIERFMDGSGKVDLTDIDWSAVPKHPVTPEALRTLRYFLTTESSTVVYTRALMKTDGTFREPDFLPFICVWMYEEEFHGRAFRRFLEAYGDTVPSDFRHTMFSNRTFGERFDEFGGAIVSEIFREAWPAVHMIWGTIQELTTYTAYQCLIDRIQHPVLDVICQRIMKQELRHYAFYREHAKRRLAASKHTQQVVSYALKLAWTPVGDGMSPTEESCHAIRFLFDGREGTAIDRIESKIRDLPGLEWFDLFSRFAHKHDIRRAPAAWLPEAAPGARARDGAAAASI